MDGDGDGGDMDESTDADAGETAAEDGEAGERWQAVDVFVRLLS